MQLLWSLELNMPHSIEYRICCVTEGINKYWVLSNSVAAPTTCPTDAGHTVSLPSLTISKDPYYPPAVNEEPPEYDDNTAAKAGGLDNGDRYRTGDLLKVVHE